VQVLDLCELLLDSGLVEGLVLVVEGNKCLYVKEITGGECELL